ncbi:lactonase family protein [Acetobacter conturbans]|uniref:Beta-propeller fold lactonase family protein n=1 Tax=Acetobacter conturbans TaxID=1737472 RepID=A0ABX0K112_9PROT|nr:lactonase family protein [Acetobacter conturbans]NHN89354.1 beta-propeller fold lactonase family protein [Acetobacter conturbans]
MSDKKDFGRRLFSLTMIGAGVSTLAGKAFAEEPPGKAPPPAPIPKAALPKSTPEAAARKSGPRTLCYVGGYTRPGPAETNARGITLFEMNNDTGILTQLGQVTAVDNPSFLAFSPDHRFLYTVNEINDFEAEKSGSATAFSVDPRTGVLTKLNAVSTGGADPAYLSVHPSGQYLLVANYTGGSVAVIRIQPDGSLGDRTDLVHNTGPKMPERAKDNPPGNYAVSDHASSHMHMVQTDMAGHFVIGADAGLDRIYIWKLDLEKGVLIPAEKPWIAMEPGSAPRHFCFSLDGKIIYILGEQDSRVVIADYDRKTGEFSVRQTATTVTAKFRGSTLAAEIGLHPSGKFLYVTNRLGDSIACFRVKDDGSIELFDETWEHANYGRSFAFDPSGRFFFVANQRSDSITSWRVDTGTGALDFTWNFTPIGTPSAFAFTTLVDA